MQQARETRGKFQRKINFEWQEFQSFIYIHVVEILRDFIGLDWPFSLFFSSSSLSKQPSEQYQQYMRLCELIILYIHPAAE